MTVLLTLAAKVGIPVTVGYLLFKLAQAVADAQVATQGRIETMLGG